MICRPRMKYHKVANLVPKEVRFSKLERMESPPSITILLRLLACFSLVHRSCYRHVEMVASIGVLGCLKLSIRRDIITEDMLACYTAL